MFVNDVHKNVLKLISCRQHVKRIYWLVIGLWLKSAGTYWLMSISLYNAHVHLCRSHVFSSRLAFHSHKPLKRKTCPQRPPLYSDQKILSKDSLRANSRGGGGRIRSSFSPLPPPPRACSQTSPKMVVGFRLQSLNTEWKETPNCRDTVSNFVGVLLSVSPTLTTNFFVYLSFNRS